MRVKFHTLNGRQLTMLCTVPQFLDGPVMSHLAALQNDCDPAELIRDHLPVDITAADDDELAERFGEACLAVVNVDPMGLVADPVRFTEITDIRVEEHDLSAIRQHVVRRFTSPFQAQAELVPLPAA